MKKFFSFVIGLLLFLSPIAVQSDEIVEAPSPDSLSEEAIRYLHGEACIKEVLVGKATWLRPNLITTSQIKNRQKSPTSTEH